MTSFWIPFVLIIITIVLGVLRIAGNKTNLFKSLAHVFVGGLLGAWFAGGETYIGYLGWGLTILEVICFALFKIKNYIHA